MRIFFRCCVIAFMIGSAAYYAWGVASYVPHEFDDGAARWLVGGDFEVLIIAIVLGSIGMSATSAPISGLLGRNSRKFRDAPVGIGEIVSVSPTGTTINNHPVVRLDLKVTGANGERFHSTARKLVPVTQLPWLTPGASVAVRYLPGKTDVVELDRSGDESAAQAAIDYAMLAARLTTPEALEIHRQGVHAKGVITALSVTGALDDGRPKLDLDIVVTRPDGSTFATHKDPAVPPGAVRHLQVGSVVNVRYLEYDESQSVVEVPSE